MTALSNYDRLEATGLWRPSDDVQRREVIVSLGEATLVITDMNEKALTHWSLAAIERVGQDVPAVYHPVGDASETLELPGTEHDMIAAIDRLRRAVSRARPSPGRLRWLGAVVSALAVLALLFVWLPNALLTHAVRVVPDVKRAEIGEALLRRFERVSGAPCSTPQGRRALDLLAKRLGIERLVVLRGGVPASVALPGGIIVVNRTLIEDYEEPDVVAGFALVEQTRGQSTDVLREILEIGGIRASATLLTTGRVPDETLDQFAETALSAQRGPIASAQTLNAFAEARLRTTPYAYAVDVSGESTLALIEADPMKGQPPEPVLRDAQWLHLQAICGG